MSAYSELIDKLDKLQFQQNKVITAARQVVAFKGSAITVAALTVELENLDKVVKS